RASASLARLRRQGGLPRRVRRAAGARRTGQDAGRHAPLRPALDIAGERGGAVGRAASLVPEAPRARPLRPWRRGVRALVLGPDGRAVLMRFRDDVWACP